MSISEYCHPLWLPELCELREVLSELIDSYSAPHITNGEREMIEATLTCLLDDPNTAARAMLADAVVASNRESLKHIVLALSGDVPEVASIVIAHSNQLSEDELIDIVAAQDEQIQYIVACREIITSPVAAAVAEIGSFNTTIKMLHNEGAEITSHSLMRILERWGFEPSVRRAVEARKFFPIGIRQLVYRLDIIEEMKVIPDEMEVSDHLNSEAIRRNDQTIIAMAGSASDEDLDEFCKHLHDSRQLTTALIIRAAMTGEMRFVVTALSHLSGIARDTVNTILNSGNLTVWQAVISQADCLAEEAIPVLIAAAQAHCELRDEQPFETTYTYLKEVAGRILQHYWAHCSDTSDSSGFVSLLSSYAKDSLLSAARAQLLSVNDPFAALDPVKYRSDTPSSEEGHRSTRHLNRLGQGLVRLESDSDHRGVKREQRLFSGFLDETFQQALSSDSDTSQGFRTT